MSLLSKTVSGIKWQYSSLMLQLILQIIVMMVLARYILPEEYGLVSMANIIVFFAIIFSQVGLGPAIIQQGDVNVKVLKSSYAFSVYIGVFIFIFLFFVASLFSDFFNEPQLKIILRVIGFSFIINGFGVIPRALLEKNFKFKELMITNIFSYFIGYGIIGVFLAINGFGVWTLVIALLTQNILQILLWNYYSPKRFSLFISLSGFKEMKFLLIFGGGQTLISFFNTLALQGDKFIVGKFLGTDALGFYGRSFTLMELPHRHIGGTIDRVMFPALVKIKEEEDKLKNVLFKTFSISSFILFPISFFMIFYANEIVLIMLGPAWSLVVLPLKILCIVMPFRTYIRIFDSLIRALGIVYKGAKMKFIYSLSVIFFAYIGNYFGIVGVAIGVNLAVVLNFILMFYLIKRNIYFPIKSLLLELVSPLLLTIVIFFVNYLIDIVFIKLDLPIILNMLIVGVLNLMTLSILSLKAEFLMGENWYWFLNNILKSSNKSNFITRIIRKIFINE